MLAVLLQSTRTDIAEVNGISSAIVVVAILFLFCAVVLPNKKTIDSLGSETVAEDNSLFSCFFRPCDCLLACFCPCIVFGQNVQALDDESCVPLCVSYCCGCGIGMAGAFRRTIYEKTSGTNPGLFVNAVTHCACGPCALAQEKMAIESLHAAPSQAAAERQPLAPAAATGPEGDATAASTEQPAGDGAV